MKRIFLDICGYVNGCGQGTFHKSRPATACAPEALDAVRAVFQRHGFGQAAIIGQMLPRGERALMVRAR
jgi:hypothetical protein